MIIQAIQHLSGNSIFTVISIMAISLNLLYENYVKQSGNKQAIIACSFIYVFMF